MLSNLAKATSLIRNKLQLSNNFTFKKLAKNALLIFQFTEFYWDCGSYFFAIITNFKASLDVANWNFTRLWLSKLHHHFNIQLPPNMFSGTLWLPDVTVVGSRWHVLLSLLATGLLKMFHPQNIPMQMYYLLLVMLASAYHWLFRAMIDWYLLTS